MKIKDWMKLGAGVLIAHCTYSFLNGLVGAMLEPAYNKLHKKKNSEELKDSKPENEEES